MDDYGSITFTRESAEGILKPDLGKALPAHAGVVPA